MHLILGCQLLMKPPTAEAGADHHGQRKKVTFLKSNRDLLAPPLKECIFFR